MYAPLRRDPHRASPPPPPASATSTSISAPSTPESVARAAPSSSTDGSGLLSHTPPSGSRGARSRITAIRVVRRLTKITVEPPGPRTSHAAAALVAPCTAPRRAFLIPHQRRVSSALPPIPHGDAPMAHRDAPVAPRDAPVHRDAAMAHRSAPMAHREALPLAH
ncbi:hypothetical protein C8J57DRAFT_1381321 [Mycena rebaudengoi]|nr:hypothetical protein C8J57DRAFT_1381321 [Mycena rebaudengoi]